MNREFSSDETAMLSERFTNSDDDVFGLTNLPDVTKAALFARYSRSSKSLRRLFLDEFNDASYSVDQLGPEVGSVRAQGLFERVLAEYGDDSVAQLAGVHIAFENISNIATKIVERPRMMSYLEQSTRYIAYDKRDVNGNFRYHIPVEFGAEDRTAYKSAMDGLFDAYQRISHVIIDRLGSGVINAESIPPVMRATTRALGLDATRGLLPAATVSNVGVYGSAQAMEQLVLHLYANPLVEARELGAKLHRQLDIMIPSLVSRLNRPERRDPWVSYLRSTRFGEFVGKEGLDAPRTSDIKKRDEYHGPLGSKVTLVDFDADGEARISKAMLFEMSHLPADDVARFYNSMSNIEIDSLWHGYIGDRKNRRHRPGRAFEKCHYKFEIEADYGAFRDLQRHRLLSSAWQVLNADLGYFSSPRLSEGEAKEYHEAIEAVLPIYGTILDRYGERLASYCLPMAYRIRFELELDSREAMHLIELRSAPQGHESYREVAQLMYQAILTSAQHPLVANSMSCVDLTTGETSREDSLTREAQKRGDSDNLVTN